MIGGRYFQRDLLPFAVMVIVEFTAVGSTILFKSATTHGMSYFAFTFYNYFLSSAFSFCVAFIFHRKIGFPPISISLLGKIFLVMIIGFAALILGYKGIALSDPTLSSAISNLTPAFTFALAVIFRMEYVSLRSASSQAKIIGTIVSIAGALTMVLYTGPSLITPSSSASASASASANSLNQSLIGSPQPGWVLGGFLLLLDFLLLSLWYIFQAQILKQFQAVFVVAFLSNVCGLIISLPICLFMESNLKKWRLKADSAMITLLYTATIGSLGIIIHMWMLQKKGPVYVASFKPLSIAIATFMGLIFLGNTIYLGCVLGAVVVSVGFYVLMWGKIKEEDKIEDPDQPGVGSLEDSNDPTIVPLLH